mmetsp:Transcript_43079/g.71612  ORF Transcript_43079/g.71612 Transcript_43079/m.71612 type:complete len:140 (+) Transcript_43079:9-428(+)
MKAASSSSFLLSVLFGIALATKPSAESLRRALRAWVRKNQGILGEVLARGAMALDDFTGPSMGLIDLHFLTFVQLDSAQLLRSATANDFCGAVGAFGHWLGFHMREGASRLRFDQTELGCGVHIAGTRIGLFYLGSAVA